MHQRMSKNLKENNKDILIDTDKLEHLTKQRTFKMKDSYTSRMKEKLEIWKNIRF